MIQNGVVSGGGGNVEIVPVVFSRSGAPLVHIKAYTRKITILRFIR